MTASKPVIVIPAFNPDQRLIDLVLALGQAPAAYSHIVIVNDGSTSTVIFEQIAKQSDATILHHAQNRGKGAALKTGFDWVLGQRSDAIGVITADADGQHLPADILAVAKAFTSVPTALWLGSRNFSEKGIPLRSWIGNNFARITFRLGLRIHIPDTQTGLRAIPRSMLPALIELSSNGYDFELDMLIVTKRSEIPFRSLEISTVYEDGNSSSHFKPVRDSLLIYSKFLKFSSVGIASAAIDYGLFALIYGLTGEILLAIATARLVSGIFNFSLNRQWVFGRGGSLSRDATKYSLLAIALVSLNYLFTKSLLLLGISPFIGKPLAEIIVFLLSYKFQKRLVFRT